MRAMRNRAQPDALPHNGEDALPVTGEGVLGEAVVLLGRGWAQWKESPHAHEPVAFGLSMVKPCFSMVSTKSITAPLR
jgi:hypothetical protein